jgi:hypothetical protein
VLGVFAAFGAVFGQNDFIHDIDFVFFGDVILRFTDGTIQGKDLTRAFFSHEGDYTLGTGGLGRGRQGCRRGKRCSGRLRGGGNIR